VSPVQTGAPAVEDAPSPTRSLNWRAVIAPVLRNKSAMVAVGILAFFSRDLGPLLIEGDPKGEGQIFRAAEPRILAGRTAAARALDLLIAGARVSPSSGSAPPRSRDHRRHGRDPLRLLRRQD
jgi:hypothetical protein